MESNEQEKANLLNVNFLAKHMSTPLVMGGGKGSAAYMKEDARPDYPDIDGDGNKKESMAQAAKDKKNT
jgi:hypothetical protein